MKKASIYIIITLGLLLTACQNKENKHINYKDTYANIEDNNLKTKEDTDDKYTDNEDDVNEIVEINSEPSIIYDTLDEISSNSVLENHRVEKDQYDFCDDIPDRIMVIINGMSLRDTAIVSANDLRYLQFKYNDINGELRIGEMICNKEIAYDVLDIFCDLYEIGYRFEKIVLAESENCDREKLFSNNITHCFNYTTGFNSAAPSKQAFGMGLYVNPLYNPSITLENGKITIHPIEGIQYADRNQFSHYKITKGDMMYDKFIEHGFKWGGDNISSKELGFFYK